MSSDWFHSVTGTTPESQQAWRDNFNGGWAAGDWTGNHNRAIAAERYDSGEWNPQIAQYGGYTERNPAVPDGVVRTVSADGNTVYITRANNGSAVTTNAVNPVGGSGGPTAVAPNQPGGTVPGPGQSNQRGPGWYQPGGGYYTTQTRQRPGQSAGPAGNGKPDVLPVEYSKSVHELNTGGLSWESNPWWSNTEDWEIRYGEPGEWLGGLVVFGADLAWNMDRFYKGGPGVVGGTIDRSVESVVNWTKDNWARSANELPDPIQYRPMSEW